MGRADFHLIRQLTGKPPETTHFACQWRRPATWCFTNGAQTARVNSLTIAAGGLRAKERSSFKRAFSAPSSLQRRPIVPFGAKTKTQSLEFEMSFRSCPSFCPPKLTKHDMVSPGGTWFETALKTGRNWNDGTLEPKPSSGSNSAQKCVTCQRCPAVTQGTSFYRWCRIFDASH